MTKGSSISIPFYLTVPLFCPGNTTCGIDINIKQTTQKTDSMCTGHLDTLVPSGNKTHDITENDWERRHHIRLNHIGRKGYGVNPKTFQINLNVNLSNTIYEFHEKIREIKVN